MIASFTVSNMVRQYDLYPGCSKTRKLSFIPRRTKKGILAVLFKWHIRYCFNQITSQSSSNIRVMPGQSRVLQLTKFSAVGVVDYLQEYKIISKKRIQRNRGISLPTKVTGFSISPIIINTRSVC